jgi:protein tyrosine/serine phosphatase
MNIYQKTNFEEEAVETNRFGILSEKDLYKGYEVVINFTRLKSLIKACNLPFIVKIELDTANLHTIDEGLLEFYKSVANDDFDKNATDEERILYSKAFLGKII